MHVDGRCHCGAITFEAEVDPAAVMICHCTDCQTLSGTAFRTVVPTEAGTFQLLSGALKTYIKVAESGSRRAQTFCPECGTPIYSGAADGSTSVVNIRVGTIRQRDTLPPKAQYWCRSAQGWATNIASTTKCDTQ